MTYYISAPGEERESQKKSTHDLMAGTWRVYFYDLSFDEVKVKEAYINMMDLKFEAKIDYKNEKIVRSCLEKWTIKYLQDKKFEDIEDIEDGFKIKL